MRTRAYRVLFSLLILIVVDRSKTHLLTLYFLDSGAYAEGFFSWLGLITTDYDWIHKVIRIQKWILVINEAPSGSNGLVPPAIR